MRGCLEVAPASWSAPVLWRFSQQLSNTRISRFHPALTKAKGGTGHWPVPSGDPPLGTGQAHELFYTSVFSENLLPIPSGQWPGGTGGSPVPPIPTSEFAIMPSI